MYECVLVAVSSTPFNDPSMGKKKFCILRNINVRSVNTSSSPFHLSLSAILCIGLLLWVIGTSSTLSIEYAIYSTM